MTMLQNPRWLLLGLYLALAGGTLAVYSRVASHPFVDYDDNVHIFENPHVSTGLSWANLKWDFEIHGPSQWHPLAWLSHQLDCQLFGAAQTGPGPGRHHLVSLLLHVGSVLLLFEFLRRATGAVWPSALVAALFGLHPLGVESVAWASERRDVLSALFWMLTLLAYLGYARRGGAARYLLVVLCFALGLMAKPMLVTLPCVLLLLDFWPLRRWRPRPAAGGAASLLEPGCEPQRWGPLVLEKLPLLGLSVASSVLTILCERSIGAISSLDRYPLGARLGNAVIAYGFYLRQMIWPRGLALSYPPYSFSTWAQLGSVLGVAALLAAVTVFAIVEARRRPYLLVGWLWYLGTLVPVLGLVQTGVPVFADRFTYLPLVGIYLAIAFAARDLVRRWPAALCPVSLSGFAWLACLMVATWQQVDVWRDSLTLYEHALQVTPDNYAIHVNLGNYLQRFGNPREAAVHFSRAVQLKPDPESYNRLGSTLLVLGKVPEAIENFQTALRLNPDYAEAHNNLGNALVAIGKTREAAEHFNRALQIRSDYPEPDYNLGNLLLSQGRTQQAIDHYRRALRVKDAFFEAHFALGNALTKLGQYQEAIEQYQRALQLRSDSSKVRYNLSTVLERAGRRPEAMDQFDLAIKTDNKLAWRLATRAPADGGDPARAVAVAARACQLTGYGKAELLDTLAAACASADRFPEAIASAQRAIRLARSSGQTQLGQDIESRLRLYQAHRPYRAADEQEKSPRSHGGTEKPE